MNHYEPIKGTVEHILDGHLREWHGDHLKQVPQIKIIIKKTSTYAIIDHSMNKNWQKNTTDFDFGR